MNKKGITVLFGAAALLAGSALGAAVLANRPQLDSYEKEITIKIVHSDGSIKEVQTVSDKENLEEVLLENSLVQGDQSSYGLFITEADGESADFDADGSWWQILVNGESADAGANSLYLEDGSVYTLSLTKGSDDQEQ